MSWLELSSLAPKEREAHIAEHLAGLGFTDVHELAPSLQELTVRAPFAQASDRLCAALKQAQQPRRALNSLVDAVLRLEELRGDASVLVVPPILEVLLELAGGSGSAARQFLRDPVLAIELAMQSRLSRDLFGREELDSALQRLAHAAGTDTERFDRALRRHRSRRMLHVALAELRGHDIRATSAALADLASSSLEAAMNHHHARLCEELGTLEPANSAVVLGLGKLGGRELNFSSDVDVIYVYDHDEGGVGDLSAHQWFTKLFERVTASIGRITAEGFVFRVDLDLRPEGRPGALTNSLGGLERYYEKWGQTWERAAWIKARPVAGDLNLGLRIKQALRPFVFPKSMDLAAVESLLSMKARIDRSQAKVRHLGRGIDVKLGRGGIREIEFFAQAHQLLHGGREPRLRTENTLETLLSLEACGLLSAKVRVQLGDAYLFFRQVEHRLQLEEDRQTHALPKDPEARANFAKALGFESTQAFDLVLQEHMSGVRELFEGVVGAVDDREEPPEHVQNLLESRSDEARADILQSLGAQEPDASAAQLATAARIPGSPFHRRAGPDGERLAAQILTDCLASPSLDRALRHLPDLLRSLVRHAAYMNLLSQPRMRRGVTRVLGASDLFARYLISSPALLDHVLLDAELPTRATLEDALKSDVAAEDDLEGKLGAMRTFKQQEVLRTALAELGGSLESAHVPERLTTLAEILIHTTMCLALSEQEERFGAPADPNARLVLVAGGTVGARETSYRTDIDLSMFFEGEGETVGGVRSAISVSDFYTRVMQRMLSFLSVRMARGILYPVDVRLRPSGSKGALVATYDSFVRYHRDRARLWERQALVRSRPVAGDSGLASKMQDALHEAVYERGLEEDAAAEIHKMSVRMRQERSTSKRRRTSGQSIDLKFGVGGLVEIEFLVQYLLMRHGGERVELRTTSTQRALAALGRSSILTPRTAKRMMAVHARLKRIQNWRRVALDEMVDHVDLRPAVLRPLALAVGYEGLDAAAQLERDIRADMEWAGLAYAKGLGIDPQKV